MTVTGSDLESERGESETSAPFEGEFGGLPQRRVTGFVGGDEEADRGGGDDGGSGGGIRHERAKRHRAMMKARLTGSWSSCALAEATADSP